MAGILGVDMGEARTGIAYADNQTRLAVPLETFEGVPGKKLALRLKVLADEYQAGTIVAGLPLNFDGAEGAAATKVREKVEWLKTETGLTWILWDERLTSHEAEALLQEQGVRRDKRKGLRDQLAAQRILQSFLDHQKEVR